MKGKIYKNITTNVNKSYLGYLNKLVDEYNNTYHGSISKKSIDAHYSALNKKNPKIRIVKILSLKLVIESELLS